MTTRRALGLAALLAAAGCGNVQGLGGPPTPLVTFNVEASGDLDSLRPPGITSEVSPQIALVWGAQWQPEPFCFLPPATTDLAVSIPGVPPASTPADVIAAGCRDSLGFVPARADVSVPVTINGSAVTLSLDNVPATDLLVGGATSRVAYASLVFYDDRDGSGTLDLSTPHSTKFGGGDEGDQQNTPDSTDVIYGASFLTMTAADTRVAYLEGTFDPTAAFYPRNGCANPPDGFSVVEAGGFSADAVLPATLAGTFPTENPPCTNVPSTNGVVPTVVSIAAQAPADVAEVSCLEQTLDGSTRYREPPADALDFTDRLYTCAPLPSLGAGTQPNLIQLVVTGIVSGASPDHCKGLTHYTLRGCREDVACVVPDWDFTANPPTWWPCQPPN